MLIKTTMFLLILGIEIQAFGNEPKVKAIWHNAQGDFLKDSLLKIQKGSPLFLKYNEVVNIKFQTIDNKQLTYKFCIKPNDIYSKWQTLGTEPFVQIPALEGGKYELIVSSMDDQFIYRLPIIVQITWWQEWWFYPVIILYVIILIGIGIYLFFLYDFRQKLKMQSVRNRIAADLHDEVGSNLNSIAIYTELLRKKSSADTLPILDKIIENSRESVSLMQDTVWAINPKNDDTEKLFERMKSFGYGILTAKDIALGFDSQIDAKKVNFSMDQRKNIYLIYKEAINNIAKHSKATKADVRIFEQDNQIKILITDNGEGFDTNIDSEGNGLKNFKNRAEEAEIGVKMASTIGKGTKVFIEVDN